MPNYRKDDSPESRSEFWGICCESGKRYSQVVSKKFHISMAALDPTDTSTSPCVSLMVERDGCQYLLCSLKPDGLLQEALDLYFDTGEDITFFLKGHGTVHLSGYYICHSETQAATNSHQTLNHKGAVPATKKDKKLPFTVSDDPESSDSSEMEGAGRAANATKVPSPVKKSILKSPKKEAEVAKKEAASDEDLLDDDEDDDSWEDEESDDEDLDEDMDEEDEDEEDEDEQKPSSKRDRSAVDSEEDSSDEDSDSDDLKKVLNKYKQQMQLKKVKREEPSPAQQNNKSGKKSIGGKLEQDGTGKPDLNSSIGRTPMPKKLKAVESSLSSPQLKSPKKENALSGQLNSSPAKTPDKSVGQLNASVLSSKKKKKKSKETPENQTGEQIKVTPQKKFSHKLSSGVEYEDIRIGNGLPAKKGKLVHVYYTGQLENNKVFDSCLQGSKPFSFRLAAGKVIKGWDLGIEGMKVGGKRRLKIPAHMGYGKQGQGPIPPNSTLYFSVELKAVS